MTVGSHLYTRAGASRQCRLSLRAGLPDRLRWWQQHQLDGESGNGFGGNGGGTSDAFAAHHGKNHQQFGYLSGATRTTGCRPRGPYRCRARQLKADFNAESWGGRIEGGYRLPTDYFTLGWTPYAAFTGQSFHTPNYGEIATLGSNQFALNIASRTATAYRGEIGLRTDKVMAVDNGGQVSLFGKVAYAYDSVSNPAAAASFAALGAGSNFLVFGATPSQNLLLSTSGVEWRLASGLSFMVKADSEWGDRSHTYTGTGRIRYTW